MNSKAYFMNNIRSSLFSRRVTRIGVIAGILCTPFTAFNIYEKYNPLPDPLSNCPYPLLARWYIRRSIWSEDDHQKAYLLDLAMRKVLEGGYGAASPQSTNLVIYLSAIYLHQSTPDISNLLASFATLTHKPHVGEGVKEEQARLNMAFKVGIELCRLLREDGDANRMNDIAKKALNIMEKAPVFLGDSIRKHPSKSQFESFLNYS